jgi:serine/threonine protein phosphatase PrpC
VVTGGPEHPAGAAAAAASPAEPAAHAGPAGGGGSNGAAPASAACPACGAEVVAGTRFCEACGHDLTTNGPGPPRAGADEPAGPDEPADAGGTPAEPGAGTGDADTGAGCVRCGAEVGPDGYCTSCGHRALEPVTVDDRGAFAYAGHRGRRHARNEDSCALGATSEGWPVLVVSDGVSASPNPHKASAAAVTAATRRLVGRPFTRPDDLVEAVADAHAAASGVAPDGDPHWPEDGSHPACTIVVAVATPSAVHVANVGDARAHLLTRAEGRWSAAQVSTDDSVAAQAVAQGIEVEVALALPGGHGITAWLGADAPEPRPHVASRPAAPGDMLLACSDGLWNYAPTDEAMSALVSTMLAPPGDTAAPVAEPLGPQCERLVSWANDQGGNDNITVALAPVRPAAGDGAADAVAREPAGGDPDLDPSDPEENP